MKKYRILAAVAIPVTAGLLAWRAWGITRPQEVTLYTVISRTAEETVRCTGVVESAERYEVFTDLSCKTEQVLAQVGHTVQKGDVLLTVDVAATVAAAAVSGRSVTASEVRRELTAPEDGVVLAVNAAEGKMTDASRPCVVIASLSRLQLNVSVRESLLRRVAVGQRVHIRGDAFTAEEYSGTLTHLSASASPSAAVGKAETAVDAVVTLDNGQADDSLRLGLTARAEIVVNRLEDVPIVPYECVLQDADGTEYVYVAEDGCARRRALETAAELPDGYAVTAGLRAGDRLICNPSAIRRDGQPIREGGNS